MANASMLKLRARCLRLPESYEQETWDAPTFRVREKIFVKAGCEANVWVAWCKALPGVQEMLVTADPTHYFVPPYLGGRGWVGIHLRDDVDWDDVSDLVEESYRLVAPKRLAERIDAAAISSSSKE